MIRSVSTIEKITARIRHAVKAHEYSPSEQVTLDHVYMAIASVDLDLHRLRTLNHATENRR